MNFGHLKDFIANGQSLDVELYSRHVKACRVADLSGKLPLFDEWFSIYYSVMRTEEFKRKSLISRIKSFFRKVA